MKTIRKLNAKKLDQLQARLMGRVWNGQHVKRRGKMLVRVAEERMRRIRKELP